MKRRRIVVVGAGFSGAAVAAQLLKQRGRRAPEVALIERDKRFGPGLAYGGLERSHLLNVRASNMSALPDQPDHFVRWLGRRDRAAMPHTFAPRMRYGQYVEDVLDLCARGTRGRLKRLRAEVVGSRRQGSGWLVECSDGRQLEADAVVIAIGHGSSATPRVFEAGGVSVIDAWDPQAVRKVPRGRDVLIIGAGLTMIDIALSLSRDARMGVIYALSRRGLIPRGHLFDPTPASPAASTLPDSLSEALGALRKEVRAAQARGEPWQYAIDRLRARTPDLWRGLSLEQQQRFLRHARPWWDVHRHRAAPEVAERVAALQASGRLRVLAGEVVSALAHADGIEVQHRQRGSHARHRLVVSRVVNCTGAANDLAVSSNPLIRQMLADGLARGHANGLGFDVDEAGQILDKFGTAHADLFAIGPLTQGAFWECTAVPEIRVRAAQLAAALEGLSAPG